MLYHRRTEKNKNFYKCWTLNFLSQTIDFSNYVSFVPSCSNLPLPIYDKICYTISVSEFSYLFIRYYILQKTLLIYTHNFYIWRLKFMTFLVEFIEDTQREIIRTDHETTIFKSYFLCIEECRMALLQWFDSCIVPICTSVTLTSLEVCYIYRISIMIVCTAAILIKLHIYSYNVIKKFLESSAFH